MPDLEKINTGDTTALEDRAKQARNQQGFVEPDKLLKEGIKDLGDYGKVGNTAQQNEADLQLGRDATARAFVELKQDTMPNLARIPGEDDPFKTADLENILKATAGPKLMDTTSNGGLAAHNPTTIEAKQIADAVKDLKGFEQASLVHVDDGANVTSAATPATQPSKGTSRGVGG
jgi:hypothetical protein